MNEQRTCLLLFLVVSLEFSGFLPDWIQTITLAERYEQRKVFSILQRTQVCLTAGRLHLQFKPLKNAPYFMTPLKDLHTQHSPTLSESSSSFEAIFSVLLCPNDIIIKDFIQTCFLTFLHFWLLTILFIKEPLIGEVSCVCRSSIFSLAALRHQMAPTSSHLWIILLMSCININSSGWLHLDAGTSSAYWYLCS